MAGMALVALSPSSVPLPPGPGAQGQGGLRATVKGWLGKEDSPADRRPDGAEVATKLFGIALASLASGAGELSFLALTSFYGPGALAAWGSGTGAAGLVGAGVYVLATTTWGLSVRTSLGAFSFLPLVMLGAYFVVLPRKGSGLREAEGYAPVMEEEEGDSEEREEEEGGAERGLLARERAGGGEVKREAGLTANLKRARSLVVP